METLETMEKLAEPYEGFTPTGQLKWLRKKGFSPNTIDFAMTDLYYSMSKGKVFESGDAMDQELLRIAKGYDDTEAKAMISQQNTLRKQMEGTKWQKILWVLKGEL